MFKATLTLLLSLVLGSLLAQRGVITGTITTDADQPVEFASVTIQEINKGTTSDGQGNFLLNEVPVGKQIITVSFIGYKSLKQTVNVKSDEVVTLDFTLQADELELQTVEVTGRR